MLKNEEKSATEGEGTRKRVPRLGLLDALRIAAALLVVLYHYTAWGHQHWGKDVSDAWPILSQFTIYGSIGVQLFFLISGFVILMSVQGKGLIAFIGSRLGRLYPAYWLAVAAAAVLTFGIWPEMRDGRSAGDIAPNLTMAQAGMGVRDLDGVYWTLWVELRFYIILAVLVAFRKVSERAIMALSLIWPLLGVFLHLIDASKAQEWVMGQYAPLFAIGMITFLMYQGKQTSLRWGLIAFNAVLASYYTGVKGHKDASFLSGVDIPAWHFSLLTLGCIAILLLCTLTRLRTVHAKWMVSAGALTYPLYLIHQLWGWWIIELFSAHINKYLLLLLTVLTMLGLSYLVARFVEKPVGLWLRKEFVRGASLLSARLRALAAAGEPKAMPPRKYHPHWHQIR